MRKHLVATLVAGTILTTGAFAHCGGVCGHKNSQMSSSKQCGKMYKQQDKKAKQCGKMYKQQGKKDKKYSKRGKQNKMPFMRVLKELDLSSDQQAKIKEVMLKKQKDRVKFSSFFSETSFDRAKYEAHIKEIRENSFKNRSQMIEDVYNVLNEEQKKKFKTLLEQQEERKMQKRQGK